MKPAKKKAPTFKLFVMRIDPELSEKLRVACFHKRMTRSEFVRNAINAAVRGVRA